MARIGLRRLESQIRLVISSTLQTKLADPRLEQLASITRVELSPDLSFANVHISVMGSDGQQRAYMSALNSAHGVLQRRLAGKLRTRTCPTIRFHLDQSLKTGSETIRLIDKAMDELGDRAEAAGEGDPVEGSPSDDRCSEIRKSGTGP